MSYYVNVPRCHCGMLYVSMSCYMSLCCSVTVVCSVSVCHAICHCIMLCVTLVCRLLLWFDTLSCQCYMLCGGTITQISDEEVKQRIDKLSEDLHQNQSLTEVC